MQISGAVFSMIHPAGHRTAVKLGHLHRPCGQMLVPVVELTGVGAEHPLDSRPRREEVGDDFPVGALHARETQQRMLAPVGQLPHDRGDVLVERDLPVDSADIVGMGDLVVA